MATKKPLGNQVFVYGSLLRGQPNHSLLEEYGALYLGEAETTLPFYMVSLGAFPAVTRGSWGRRGSAIWGEVYLVSDEGLAALDRLEGCPNFYQRDRVEVAFRVRERAAARVGVCTRAWMWTLRPEQIRNGVPAVPDGDWRSFVESTPVLDRLPREGV